MRVPALADWSHRDPTHPSTLTVPVARTQTQKVLLTDKRIATATPSRTHAWEKVLGAPAGGPRRIRVRDLDDRVELAT
jgi:hypothetical protein